MTDQTPQPWEQLPVYRVDAPMTRWLPVEGRAYYDKADADAAHAADAARIAELEAENKELRRALRVLRKGLTADADGEFWSARRFLDERGVYHGDINGERVLEEVAKVALKKSAAPAVSSPEEP